MSGTILGGLKAARTNRQRYGHDHYARIGSRGGKNGAGKPRGFGSMKRGKDGLTGRERARIAGARGGHISRRGKVR